jgi:RHS repeat-associated protein
MGGSRSFQSSTGYRYGMNGQEKDDEIFSGAYTAEYWEYDSRTGRRWNTDPIPIAWNSPYACFNGNPVYYADPHGLKGDPPIKKGETVDLGNGETFKSSFDEVEVTANKPSLFSKIGNFFKSGWDAFVRFDKNLENQKDKPEFDPAIKTNFSGLQPTSEGPQKGVSFKSNASGIENTTPYNPGSIIMGIGGGASSQATWSEKIKDVFETVKGFPDAFSTGSDLIDGIKDEVQGSTALTNGNESSVKQSVNTSVKQGMSVPEPPVLIYYTLQTDDGFSTGIEQGTQKNYKQIVKQMEAKGYTIDGVDRQLSK